MQYHVTTLDESQFLVPAIYNGHAHGYTRASLVNRAHGSVHMEACIAELEPGGAIESATHAYEKGIYVFEGTLDVMRGTETFRLAQDDYALVPYGVRHALRNGGNMRVRWFEMLSPQPKPVHSFRDTRFEGMPDWPQHVPAIDGEPARWASTGHFMPREPMAPNGPGIHGLSVYRFMQQQFGARQFFMMRGNLAPGGFRSRHDHTVEEFYLGLSGTADMDIEDRTFTLARGTVAWTGVGTSHAFRHKGEAPFQWIETQAPQFPAHNGTRNYRDWESRASGT